MGRCCRSVHDGDCVWKDWFVYSTEKRMRCAKKVALELDTAPVQTVPGRRFARLQ